MKRLLALSCIFFLTVPSVFSAVPVIDVSGVKDRVTNIKGPVPADTPDAPAGDFDQKGYVGEIISRIFDTDGRVVSAFVAAFSGIMTQTNNVPKWNGDTFEVGTIWDKGGKIGIGNNDPQKTLDIAGDINFSGDLYKDGSIYVDGGKFVDGVNPLDAVYTDGRVGIGTNTPLAQLHTTSTARFDGGVNVDGVKAISASNASHNAQYTGDNRYGFFEVRNGSGIRGGYFGYGNGGDRIELRMDAATKLHIAGGSVGIGVNNPQAELHVAGNIISNNPTAENHVVTKKYVDDLVTGFSGACESDSDIVVENGLVISCTGKASWEIGAWSTCSATCGGGDQTRSAICKRDGATVADSECETAKPQTSKTCNTQVCATCKTFSNISGIKGGIFRGGTPGMDMAGDANFYLPTEKVADKLCRSKGYAEGGWTSEGLPTNQGWSPYGNITIWDWNGSSGERLCTSGSQCYSQQTPYIGNLECCTGKEPARPKCSAGYQHYPEINKCVKIADYTCKDRVNCTTPKMNICTLIPSLKNGDQFKLTVSADGSSWLSNPSIMTQTYTKGTAGGYVRYDDTVKATNGLNPINSGGDSKQNYNNQFYDGNCLVWGQSIYSYKSSNSKSVMSQVLRVVKK